VKEQERRVPAPGRHYRRSGAACQLAWLNVAQDHFQSQTSMTINEHRPSHVRWLIGESEARTCAALVTEPCPNRDRPSQAAAMQPAGVLEPWPATAPETTLPTAASSRQASAWLRRAALAV